MLKIDTRVVADKSWICVEGDLSSPAGIVAVAMGYQAKPDVADEAARRIAACINFCAGMPTEALEAGAVELTARIPRFATAQHLLDAVDGEKGDSAR